MAYFEKKKVNKNSSSMTFYRNHSFCKKTFQTYVCIQEIKNLSKNKFRRSIWELFQHIHRSSHTNKNVTQFSNDKVPLKENIHALTFINYYRSHFLLTLCSLCLFALLTLQIIILFREANYYL